MPKLLVRDLAQVVSPAGESAPLRGAELAELSVTEHAYVLCDDGRVAAVGRMADLEPLDGEVEEIDGGGRAPVPGGVRSPPHPGLPGGRAGGGAPRSVGGA